MTLTEIKPEYVFATIQKLTDGQQLVACDFAKGEMKDTAGMMVGTVSDLIGRPDSVKFFKVEG